MLLEVLSDFQISIPELGVIEARDAAAGAADLEQLPRADRGAEAPLPLPLARLPLGRARAGDRAPARARAGREPGPAHGRDRAHGPPARPEEAALDRGVDRLGAHPAADRRRRHRPRDLRAVDEHHRQAPLRHRPGGRARRGQAGRRDSAGGAPSPGPRRDERGRVRPRPRRRRQPARLLRGPALGGGRRRHLGDPRRVRGAGAR